MFVGQEMVEKQKTCVVYVKKEPKLDKKCVVKPERSTTLRIRVILHTTF